MGFTAYLKTILSDLFCGPQPNKNQHAQRHGNKASGRNGSWKGSHQHKTMLPQKGQHQGTTTARTTQEKKNHRYLPHKPPAPPPNSPRPRPIRLPQNPPPAPPPSPRPRPIRLGFPSGEPQANNTAQVEAQKSVHIQPHLSSASAPATLQPPPNINKPLPRLPRFQGPMFPFPVTAFTPPSQGHDAQTKAKAKAQVPKTPTVEKNHKQREQETEFLTLLALLEKALRHTHYAVCGRAALYVWGYRPQQQHSSESPPPEKINIVCPDGNEAIILSWAKAQGWASVVSSANGCSFEVPIPSVPVPGNGNGGRNGGGKGEKVKEVTVKTAIRIGLTLQDFGNEMPMAVKGTWAEAEEKMVLKTQAAVVTLPALLGMLMEGFVTEVSPRQRQEQQEQGSRAARVDEAAKVILWVLGRLVERGERLSQDKVPEAFLIPFLAGWPEAHALLEELGLSTTFISAFEAFELDRDEEPQPQPQPQPQQPKSEPSPSLPLLDAVTLAALEGLPLPSVPPPVPPKAPGRRTMRSMMPPVRRTTSPASSCVSGGSGDTIALIENEIESWNCLSLEEQSETTSSWVSRAETAESIIWASACSSSTAPSSVSSVPALSVSASSCHSEKSGTQSSSGRSILRVPPPWKSDWDERMVRKGEYPEWI